MEARSPAKLSLVANTPVRRTPPLLRLITAVWFVRLPSHVTLLPKFASAPSPSIVMVENEFGPMVGLSSSPSASMPLEAVKSTVPPSMYSRPQPPRERASRTAVLGT